MRSQLKTLFLLDVDWEMEQAAQCWLSWRTTPPQKATGTF